jgi:hypothetical protein
MIVIDRFVNEMDMDNVVKNKGYLFRITRI